MIAALAVVLAVLVVYAQSLGGPLLWDDLILIPGVPLIEHGGTLDDYLKAPFWSGVNPDAALKTYYRPLVTLSFALDHAVHGDNAAGYHLTNVALHVTCALLVFFLLRKHGVRPAVASLLGVGWAVLPRLAEAGAWVSGRTEMLATSFALGALIAWGPGTGRRVLASFLIGLGLLGKESAAAAVLAILLGEWVAARGEATGEKLRRTTKALAPILVVLAVYATLRLRALGFVVAERKLGALGRLLAVLDATGTYGAMLLDPFRPRALIGVPEVPEMSGVIAGAVLIVALGVLVVRTWGKLAPTTVVGLGLAFGSIFPVLHVVPLPVRTLAADRFLYLPTAGLVLALGPLLDRVLAARRPAWLVATSFVLALGLACSHRVSQWSDEIAFWVQTYLETPRSNNSGATNLAALYYRVGMYEDALTIGRRGLGYDDPNKRTARYNIALTLSRLGRNEEAQKALFDSAPGGKPDKERLFHLSLIDLRLGRHALARARLEESARLGHPGARWLLPHLPELEQGQREVAAAGEAARPADRARLASTLGADALAVADWARAVAAPDSSPAVAKEGLIALVQSGGPDVLRAAVRSYTARFGPIEPSMMASIEVRLADLDRLVAARSVVGLAR